MPGPFLPRDASPIPRRAVLSGASDDSGSGGDEAPRLARQNYEKACELGSAAAPVPNWTRWRGA